MYGWCLSLALIFFFPAAISHIHPPTHIHIYTHTDTVEWYASTSHQVFDLLPAVAHGPSESPVRWRSISSQCGAYDSTGSKGTETPRWMTESKMRHLCMNWWGRRSLYRDRRHVTWTTSLNLWRTAYSILTMIRPHTITLHARWHYYYKCELSRRAHGGPYVLAMLLAIDWSGGSACWL